MLTLVGESWLLFGLSVVLWIALTLFESFFAGISLGTERLITFLGLVLLPGIGAGNTESCAERGARLAGNSWRRAQ